MRTGDITVDGIPVGSIDVVISNKPQMVDIADAPHAGPVHLASLEHGIGGSAGRAGAPYDRAAPKHHSTTPTHHDRAPAKHSPFHHATGERAAQGGHLADTRQRFGDELKDPSVRERMMRLTEAEVGGQGPKAAQAFAESVMNRAAARGQTLTEAMGSHYFPAGSRRGTEPTARDTYGNALDQALGGSNISGFATGNASGKVGFGGGPQTYAPGTGERFGIEAQDFNWATRMAEGERPATAGKAGEGHLEAAEGRHPNLSQVDPRLREIVGAGATHLPDGYRAVVNEGYNPHGHAPGSQHHIPGRGALDVQIIGPNGPIPNRGRDTTGLYTDLARASYGEMQARHPDLEGQFNWGGSFETSRGSGVPDLMHFDLGGRSASAQQLRRMGSLPDRTYGAAKPAPAATAETPTE